MAHCHEDISVTNPLFAMPMGAKKGAIQGKEVVGKAWKRVMDGLSRTRFKLLGVFAGVDGFWVLHEGIFEKKAVKAFVLDANTLNQGPPSRIEWSKETRQATSCAVGLDPETNCPRVTPNPGTWRVRRGKK